jgi:DNA gyrase subunit B
MNALSCRFIVEVQTEGLRWRQEFSRGVAVTPLSPVGPSRGAGTTLTFWPDPDIFKEESSFSFTTVRERLREIACHFADPSIQLRDHRLAPAQECRFHSGMDLRDLLEVHSRGTMPVHPTLVHGKAVVPEGEIEVAFRWIQSRAERFIGFANLRRTDRGGNHLTGLHRGIAQVWNPRLRLTTQPDGTGMEPGPACRAGLLAIVAVRVQEPRFQGSTMERLHNPEIEAPVARLVCDCLEAFLRAHPDEADAIADHLRAPAEADPKSGSL